MIFLILSSAYFGFILGKRNINIPELAPIPEKISKDETKTLNKYTIEQLSKTDIQPGKIVIKEKIEKEGEEDFESFIFEFLFNPNLDGKTLKKTTGLINLPLQMDGNLKTQNKKLPLIIMLRGYINKDTFKTGDGTRNASFFFARNGFITIAPDFLGYGGSDKETENIFEARFQTYTTILSLVKTLESVSNNPNLIKFEESLENSNKFYAKLINYSDIFFWAHSNGGQIALTFLEITGKKYPTTLWAPVSAAFPYSVLYYTNKSEDRGKLIRRELAKFEERYDVDLYSPDLYLDRINAPLQIHQGFADDAVPVDWTDSLVAKLKKEKKEVFYYKYPQTDHNMRPVWNTVILRDLEFFSKYK